jgi:hypothetical protein
MADDTEHRALLAAALASRNEGIKLYWRESDLTCRWLVPAGNECMVGRRMLAYLIDRAEKEEEITNEAVREQWHELVWTLLENPNSPFALQRLTWLMRVAESPHRDETNTDTWNLYLWNLRLGELPPKVASPLVESLGIKDPEAFIDMDTAATQHYAQRSAAFEAQSHLSTVDALRQHYDQLKHFRALLLCANPGTGKSHLARLLARHWSSLSSGRALGAFHFVPLGPGSNAANLIERESERVAEAQAEVAVNLRQRLPDDRFFFDACPGFEDGLLLRAFAQAARNPRQDFLVLLDDIESIDPASALGELLTVLDSGARVRYQRGESGSKAWQLDEIGSQLIRLRHSQRLFFLPDNVYLVATARQEDAAIVSRLRGRFAVCSLEQLSSTALSEELLRSRSLLERVRVEDYLDPTVRLFSSINEILVQELGEHAMLGHVPLYAMVDAILGAEDHLEALRALAFTWRNELLPNLIARMWELSSMHLLAPGAKLSSLVEQSWLNVRIVLRGAGSSAYARIESTRERG